MNLCIIGATSLMLSAPNFTLEWTHSIQKTRWIETWDVTEAGLKLREAAIESTGAGMEMPEEAKFDGHFWRWTPKLPALPELALARSDAVPTGWQLCAKGHCQNIGDKTEKADIVRLKACKSL